MKPLPGQWYRFPPYDWYCLYLGQFTTVVDVPDLKGKKPVAWVGHPGSHLFLMVRNDVWWFDSWGAKIPTTLRLAP